jgi:hypothetical protein
LILSSVKRPIHEDTVDEHAHVGRASSSHGELRVEILIGGDARQILNRAQRIVRENGG